MESLNPRVSTLIPIWDMKYISQDNSGRAFEHKYE